MLQPGRPRTPPCACWSPGADPSAIPSRRAPRPPSGLRQRRQGNPATKGQAAGAQVLGDRLKCTTVMLARGRPSPWRSRWADQAAASKASGPAPRVRAASMSSSASLMAGRAWKRPEPVRSWRPRNRGGSMASLSRRSASSWSNLGPAPPGTPPSTWLPLQALRHPTGRGVGHRQQVGIGPGPQWPRASLQVDGRRRAAPTVRRPMPRGDQRMGEGCPARLRPEIFPTTSPSSRGWSSRRDGDVPVNSRQQLEGPPRIRRRRARSVGCGVAGTLAPIGHTQWRCSRGVHCLGQHWPALQGRGLPALRAWSGSASFPTMAGRLQVAGLERDRRRLGLAILPRVDGPRR